MATHTVESENTSDSGVKGPIVLAPWLVFLAALALYGCTLHHWVTFGSLPLASQIMGWDWHPGPLPWRADPMYHPLLLIFSLPLRWLPADWRVAGMNFLTAIFAAMTLAILARSVRLLAQKSTKEQRLREPAADGLLSIRTTFLPATFAVLLLAAQSAFWENAVAATGEMLDLLVFAFLIFCLLDFRVTRKESRLFLFAFVYGIGVANNWALIGFFPCFLVALVWIKGMEIFDSRFIALMLACGAFGLLLYALIPLEGAAAGDGGFWELLHQTMATQRFFLGRVPRSYAVFAALPSLLPLIFAAIRWPSFKGKGDINAFALNASVVFFRVLHILFLAVGVFMFFEARISVTTRNFSVGSAPGTPAFLTFYYLAALSVGYYSGYVLLVFGKDAASNWRRARGSSRVANFLVVALLWVAAIGLPAILFIRNFPLIQEFNGPVVADFGTQLARSLPAKPAVVIADDPALLYLAMGASQRLGVPDQYLFIEGRDLVHGNYVHNVLARQPSLGKLIANSDRLPDEIPASQIGELLAALSRSQPVYYLQPSFGSYFEKVCFAQQELGGYLRPYPTNVLASPVLTSAAVATNQSYWRALEKGPLAMLPELAATSYDASRIAEFYSKVLNTWGVELQKASTAYGQPALLGDANDQFSEALRLNPDNLLATADQIYNAHLRGAAPARPGQNPPDLAQFNNHWDAALNLFGEADTPELDLQIGNFFAEHGAFRQAAGLFERCLDFTPNDPAAELDLAKSSVELGDTDRALRLIKLVRDHGGGDPAELAFVEAMAYAGRDDFAQADKLLTDAQNKNPKDEKFAGAMGGLYRLMGYRVLQEAGRDAAKQKSAEQNAAVWFRKSIALIDAQLGLLNNLPSTGPEISALNLRKVEIQMAMKDYDAAIPTLNGMLRQDPVSSLALLNRAICELQINRLDAAKTDYEALEKMAPQPNYTAYYGLSQIAQKQKDREGAIRYSKLCLKYAPANSDEALITAQQLRKLEAPQER